MGFLSFSCPLVWELLKVKIKSCAPEGTMPSLTWKTELLLFPGVQVLAQFSSFSPHLVVWVPKCGLGKKTELMLCTLVMIMSERIEFGRHGSRRGKKIYDSLKRDRTAKNT